MQGGVFVRGGGGQGKGDLCGEEGVEAEHLPQPGHVERHVGRGHALHPRPLQRDQLDGARLGDGLAEEDLVQYLSGVW